jgi:hypothetical protein
VQCGTDGGRNRDFKQRIVGMSIPLQGLNLAVGDPICMPGNCIDIGLQPGRETVTAALHDGLAQRRGSIARPIHDRIGKAFPE